MNDIRKTQLTALFVGAENPFRLSNPGNTEALITALDPFTKPDDETIARCAYEVNRLYCKTIEQDIFPPWEEANPLVQLEFIGLVATVRHDRSFDPAARHNDWVEAKVAEGWKPGPVRDDEKKENPVMVPYGELPESARRKNDYFLAVVHSLLS